MTRLEKKSVVLWARVAGTARLFDKLGGAEALHALDRCLKRISRGVDGFRGHVVRTTRDEIIATFPDVDDACLAAMAVQTRITDLPPVSGIQLAARIAFAQGGAGDHAGELASEVFTATERLLDLARPGQILISGETRAKLSPALQAATALVDEPVASALPPSQQVFEVGWAQAVAAPALGVSTLVLTPTDRELHLCLRYGNSVKVVDKAHPRLLMGRDGACDLTIRDRRASRHHARIERRGELFVLSDQSTNGTFVTVAGEPELFVRREEFVLHHSGIIAFASSAHNRDADVAEFEML